MSERKIIRVEHYDGEWCNDDEIASVLVWLHHRQSEITAEYRASATIELRSGSDDDLPVSVRILYSRPENDDEMARRREKEERWEQRRLASEQLAAQNRARHAAMVREIELGSLDHLIKKYPEQARALLQSAPDQSASEPDGAWRKKSV